MAMSYEKAVASMMAMNDIERGVGVKRGGRGATDYTPALKKYGITQQELDEFKAGLSAFGSTSRPHSGATQWEGGGDTWYLPNRSGGRSPIQSLPSPMEYIRATYGADSQLGEPSPATPSGAASATTPTQPVTATPQPESVSDTLRDPTIGMAPATASTVPSVGIPVVGEQRMVNNLPVSEVFNDTKTLQSLSPDAYGRQVEVMNGLTESKLPAGAMRRVDANGNVVVSRGSGQKMNPDGTYTVSPGDGGGVVQGIGRSDRVVGGANDPVLYHLNGYPITKSEHERRQPSLEGNMIVGGTNPADRLPPLRDSQMGPKLGAREQYNKSLEAMKLQAEIGKSKEAAASAQKDRDSREKIAGIEADGRVDAAGMTAQQRQEKQRADAEKKDIAARGAIVSRGLSTRIANDLDPIIKSIDKEIKDLQGSGKDASALIDRRTRWSNADWKAFSSDIGLRIAADKTGKMSEEIRKSEAAWKARPENKGRSAIDFWLDVYSAWETSQQRQAMYFATPEE